MKRYIAAFLFSFAVLCITEARASVMVTTDMDAEIIEVVSPPAEKGDVYSCTLKVMVKKIHFVGGGHVSDQHHYDYLLNRITEASFEFENESVKGMVKKGNLIVVNLHHASGPKKNGFYSYDRWTILRESVDFSKHKPVLFEKNGHYGYMDYRGNVIIRPCLKDAREFLDTGIAAVNDGYRWSYINYYGWSLAVAFAENNGPDGFREGLARCKNYDDLIGFMNLKGEVVIKARFHHALPFSEGLAAVCTEYQEKRCRDNDWKILKGGKWGFINKKGEIVIEARFSEVSSFKGGKAVVYTMDNKKVVIDMQGRIVK